MTLLDQRSHGVLENFPVEQGVDFSSPSSRSKGDRIDRVSRGVKSKQAAKREARFLPALQVNGLHFPAVTNGCGSINGRVLATRAIVSCLWRAKWIKWMKSRGGGREGREVQEFWGVRSIRAWSRWKACQRGFWQGVGTSKGLRWEIEKCGRMVYGSRIIFFGYLFEWCYHAKIFEMVENIGFLGYFKVMRKGLILGNVQYRYDYYNYYKFEY